MDRDLLIDMFYAAPELWYILFWILVLLIFCLVYLYTSLLKLKQKNYFLKRDRERYAETLYASKDGYFAFIHPDKKVNDPRLEIYERCSRRLAVILSLDNGVKSSFEEVLQSFYKEDEKRIQKYVNLLKEEGVSFEEDFSLKNAGRQIRLSGARISGTDGNVYCDMIWFRDVSYENAIIDKLRSEKTSLNKLLVQIEDMMDNTPYPVWLRDDKTNIIKVNKKYAEFVGAGSKEDVISKKLEILTSNGESVSKNLAFTAISSNKPKNHKININRLGQRLSFQVLENPFYADGSLEKIYTVGTMIDVSELEDFKIDLKIHQNTHLEIMGSLGTAFAVFDKDFKLSFYNKAFAELWSLEEMWLESRPLYGAFLDALRTNRMLPEVPDFRFYKNEEQKDFGTIMEAREDLLHLPNGKTYRRVRVPHPAGGLVFAFEDVSDKISSIREYNSLLMVRKEILNNLFDAVLIFASDGRLKFFNKSYVKLWKSSDEFLQTEPGIMDIIEEQKVFFSNVEDWQSLKEDLLNHMTNVATRSFQLNRADSLSLQVLSNILSDGSIMVVYSNFNPN